MQQGLFSASMWFWVEVSLFLISELVLSSFTDLQTDKASMLDEAIEYLKTLQLQVQVHALNSNLNRSIKVQV